MFYLYFLFSLIIVLFIYNIIVRGRKKAHEPEFEEMTRYFSKLRNPDSLEAKEEMKKRMNKTMEQIYGHKMTDEEFEEAFAAMKEYVRKNLKSE